MISRERFGRYAVALSRNAEMAIEELDGIFAEYLSAIAQEDLEALLSELMPALADKYGRRAAAVAKEFYAEFRAAMEDAREFEPVARGADADSVRRASLSALRDSSSMRALNSTLAGILVRHVNGAADETMVWNARSDPAHPKWALVPRSGACGFCLLIASRGFDYSSSGKVARHNNCKCATVVDFSDDPALEGYDPSALQRLYREAKGSIDNDGLYDEWREAKAADPKTGTFDNFKRNRLAARMASIRDSRVTKEAGAKPWKKEAELAKTLATRGHSVRFIKEDKSKKSPDAYLDDEEEPWEFKIPEAYNEKTVKNQFKKAIGKGTSRLLITNLKNGASGEAMLSDIMSLLKSGEFSEIREVLFVDANGTETSMKR